MRVSMMGDYLRLPHHGSVYDHNAKQGQFATVLFEFRHTTSARCGVSARSGRAAPPRDTGG
jgi:hypothetical protein